MSQSYLLVVSRDVAEEGPDTRNILDLAADLARAGSDVVLWLVHNAAFAVRDTLAERVLAPLVRFGVKVVVDEFSVRERGIPAERVSKLARPIPIDEVVGYLADGRKTLWS